MTRNHLSIVYRHNHWIARRNNQLCVKEHHVIRFQHLDALASVANSGVSQMISKTL